MSMPEKERLRCPVCGAEAFYIEIDGVTVSFSVNAGYGAEEVYPEDAALVLSGDAVVNCTACSWYGAVKDLDTPGQ